MVDTHAAAGPQRPSVTRPVVGGDVVEGSVRAKGAERVRAETQGNQRHSTVFRRFAVAAALAALLCSVLVSSELGGASGTSSLKGAAGSGLSELSEGMFEDRGVAASEPRGFRGASWREGGGGFQRLVTALGLRSSGADTDDSQDGRQTDFGIRRHAEHRAGQQTEQQRNAKQIGKAGEPQADSVSRASMEEAPALKSTTRKAVDTSSTVDTLRRTGGLEHFRLQAGQKIKRHSGSMLTLDPRIDRRDSGRQMIEQLVVFVLLIMFVYAAMRLMHLYGGGSRETSEPANRSKGSQVAQGPTQQGSAVDGPFSPLSPSSPVFFVMGLASMLPFACIVVTYPFFALLFTAAGKTEVMDYPVLVASMSMVAVLALHVDGERYTLKSKLLFGYFSVIPVLVLIPALTETDTSFGGRLALILTCVVIGASTGLTTASLYSLALLAQDPSGANEGGEPEYENNKAVDDATMDHIVDSVKPEHRNAFITPLLIGHGAAAVVSAICWLVLRDAADPSGATEIRDEILNGGRLALMSTAGISLLGAYFAYRVCADRFDEVEMPELTNPDKYYVMSQVKPYCLALAVKSLASTILFPAVLDTFTTAGKNRPEQLATILVLLHAISDMIGRAFGEGLLYWLEDWRWFAIEMAKKKRLVWLGITAVRGTILPLLILLCLALGWGDTSFLVFYVIVVGVTNGLLSTVLLKRAAEVIGAGGKPAKYSYAGSCLFLGEVLGLVFGYAISIWVWS